MKTRGLALLAASIWLSPAAAQAPAARWFKGNLHAHSINSDGDSPPYELAAWYKRNGYHFLAITDHNTFTDPAPIDTNPNDPVSGIVTLFESRGDVVGAFAGNNVFTPALVKAVAQTGLTGKICAYGFDLGPAQQDALKSGDLTGALGQQPFLQGFWPVMQLYLQIDRGISAANLDTRAQLVTQETVGDVGKRFEN